MHHFHWHFTGCVLARGTGYLTAPCGQKTSGKAGLSFVSNPLGGTVASESIQSPSVFAHFTALLHIEMSSCSAVVANVIYLAFSETGVSL